MDRKRQRFWVNSAIAAFVAIGLWQQSAESRQGRDGGDRVDRISEQSTRADRDQARAAEDAARRAADMADRQAKDAADAAERAAKDAEDTAEDAAKAAEDAADDAADAAEDAAEEAAEAAEEAAEIGSSKGMQDLASEEGAAKDDKGFPVRRGEIVALDMDENTIAIARRQGFTIIETSRLPHLDATVTRLNLPAAMTPETALATMRTAAPNSSFDYTHYYGQHYQPQGKGSGGQSAAAPIKRGNLTMGMIDTHVSNHPSLQQISVSARDFGQNNAKAPTAHGTAIASLLAREGAGTIYAANIFRGTAGAPFTSADALVKALDWLVGMQVSVINISLAGPRNAVLDRLIRKASANGHVIIAAAGNGGPSAPPAYPAALPDVIAVTAVDKKLRVYRYANQGGYVRVAAMGVDVAVAAPGEANINQSGTSFATPHIAAWMARCVGTKSPSARQNCIRKLEKSARDLGAPGRDPVYGFGFIA